LVGQIILLVFLLEVKLTYRASIIAPIRSKVPMPIPKIVGREVPASGRDAWVGAGVAVTLGVDVPPGQLQLVWVGQDGFRQKPE